MAKRESRKTGIIVRSPHFWSIAFIFIAIMTLYTFLYYLASTRIDITEWFPWLNNLLLYEFISHMHGFLFYIAFIYTAAVFWWRGAIITLLLSLPVILPRILHLSANFSALLQNLLLPFIPAVVFLLIIFALKWRQQDKQALAQREMERQAYMAQIFKAQEDERRRIAQELHDDSMQTLLVIANRAQTLISDYHFETAPEVKDHIEWIRDAILNVSEEVRRISLDLRPSILDEIGLIPALRWLGDRLNEKDGITAKIRVSGVTRKLKPEADVTIFRIVQEALNNVRRHSKATRVVVALKFTPTGLNITVQNNGKGFALQERIGKFTAGGKLGLIGMQQRAQFLNGTLNIQSSPGKGTLVSLEING